MAKTFWGKLKYWFLFLDATGKTLLQGTTQGPQGISLYYCHWLRKIARKFIPLVYESVKGVWQGYKYAPAVD